MSGLVAKSYRGRLSQRDCGDAFDVLFLDGPDDDSDEPVARRIAEDMEEHGDHLSVRYWTSEAEQSDDALRESAVRSLLGSGDGTEYEAHYSDITGYLWTDENIKVGGHDLLAELNSHLGEWCLLEIGYSPAPVEERCPVCGSEEDPDGVLVCVCDAKDTECQCAENRLYGTCGH